MWLRNFYNILTAIFLADDTLSSSSQPANYNPPVMIHKANNTWIDCGVAHMPDGTNPQSLLPYFVPPANIKGYTVSGYGVDYISNNTPSSLRTVTNSFNIQCGTGTTPASYEDYKLEAPITSGLAIVDTKGTLKQATQYDSDTHHISSERTYTVNNTSASSISVNEIGIYAPYTANAACCLIYREVLSETVTLEPGESMIFSFKRDAEVYNYTPYPA